MWTCSRCGETIEFRYIEGRRVPLHPGGGWACYGYGGSSANDYAGYYRSDESCCFLTTCPECGDEIYFVRHNGGAAWIDPPFGWPWYKHPCMDRHYMSAKGTRSTLVAESSATSEQRKDVVIGVVREAETSASKRCTVLNIETGSDQNIVLLMKNNAGFLTGRLVIYNYEDKSVSWLENESYTFRVIVSIKTGADGYEPSQTQIECPECHFVIDARKLSEHLKITHRFPQTRFVQNSFTMD
jgi:hypothetical protein